MQIRDFVNILNSSFYTGVPDSLLRPFCDYLMSEYGEDPMHHVIAANEGNAVGIAAGYHLATGKVPVVYMQNSGEGNAVNPIASLLNEQVYGIPAIFIVGWRGEPGEKDEPQHAFQGEITVSLLKELGMKTFVVTVETTAEELEKVMKAFQKSLLEGRQAAFVVSKGALEYSQKRKYNNNNSIIREEALKYIVNASGDDIIVATTGKTGRELFEIRESLEQGHEKDFLTVGSMGHASSIALGIALQKPDRKVWCIDGDGAAIMHMGAMTVIGKAAPENLIHIVINNEAHESVGGLPTAGNTTDFTGVAGSCGYREIFRIEKTTDLKNKLVDIARSKGPAFAEILCAIGSREDLGRPTVKPGDNKAEFIKNIVQ